VVAIFYGKPNRDIINSVNLFFMDPRYEDARMVFVQINELIDFGTTNEWKNDSHSLSYTTIWK
jgi:hypothetical protein